MKVSGNIKKLAIFISLLIGVLSFINIKMGAADDSEVDMILSNLGNTINTPGDDFYPSITSDGKTMVFSIKPESENNSDIYISNLVEDAWTSALPIKEINTEFDEQTPYISADGNILLFASNREGSIRPPKLEGSELYLTNDLYISYKTRAGWSQPKRLTGDVNTADNERAPSLSRDGKTLYFSRYKGDDIHSSKIYSARLNGTATGNVDLLPWPINSKHSDFALMPSNNKPGFYFSSNRPGGLGLWDIYFVSYVNDEYGEPVNLGKPINSEYNDLNITEVGNKIYFCSDRKGGLGNTDIYTITISPKIFKIPDTGFHLTVVDKKTGEPISTKLEITVSTGETEESLERFTAKSDSNGDCELRIDYYSRALMIKTIDKRFKDDRTLLIPTAGEMKRTFIEVEEAEIKAETRNDFKIDPIYFAYRSSTLSKSEIEHIRKITELLKDGPVIKLIIVGHTDARGGDSFNMKLGYTRARAVKNAFIQSGLKNAKYELSSAGKKQPSDFFAKTGRMVYNRRVEITVCYP